MPLYEYACEKCGKVFEVMQKMADDPLTVHADCGGQLDRIVSAPALHFKGSGFYITDYAKGSGGALPPGKGDQNKNAEGKSSSEGSKSEGSKADNAKSDSKSESSKSESPGKSESKPSTTPAPTTSSSSDSKS